MAACGSHGLPPSGQIVFSARPTQPGLSNERGLGDWSLFTANEDGGNVRRLADVYATFPDWSPDGKRLAFEADELLLGDCPQLGIGCVQIWTSDERGNDQRSLTPIDERSELPQWSPDGESIAFVHWAHSGDRLVETSINVMAADGSGSRAIADGLGEDTAPSWSPDGRHVAFQSNRDAEEDAGLYATWVVDTDGSNERRLTYLFRDENGFSWSPDSKQIVVAGDRGDGNMDLFLLDADGTVKCRLTQTSQDETAPLWSPDGASFIFQRETSSQQSGIVVIHLRDGSERVLSPSGEYDVSRAWSPDGKQVVFTRGGLGEESLWIMSADGTNQRMIDGPFTEPNLGTDWAPA